jgi:hypothetical protein
MSGECRYFEAISNRLNPPLERSPRLRSPRAADNTGHTMAEVAADEQARGRSPQAVVGSPSESAFPLKRLGGPARAGRAPCAPSRLPGALSAMHLEPLGGRGPERRGVWSSGVGATLVLKPLSC